MRWCERRGLNGGAWWEAQQARVRAPGSGVPSLSPQSSYLPLCLNFTTCEMGMVDLRGMSNEKREKVELEESAK